MDILTTNQRISCFKIVFYLKEPITVEESEYILHINFEEIKAEIDSFHEMDKEIAGKITSFILRLKKTASRIEPTLRKETNNERELWEEYKQLQREKLAVLDLSHEWDYIDQSAKDINPKLNFLVKDAIEELSDHISVLAEYHRAHIDILEIYNTRKIEFLALIVTVIISYLAVWEFFVRDLLVSIVFPYGLSPSLNYLSVILTLLPVFATVAWAWFKRGTYF
jgi:hypothetical protein